jgi:tetratricopeptide (TPR) repeat protein
MGHVEKAEQLLRRKLQINLSTFGPKHSDTIHTMGMLANPMMALGKFAESEQLLRTMVQLNNEVDRKCDHFYHWVASLVRVLAYQEKYEESRNLGQMAVSQSKAYVGEEHSVTMECVTNLANVFQVQGLYKESEDLLRPLVEQQTKLQGDECVQTLEVFSLFAWTLMKTGRFEEAGNLLERCFWGRLKLDGPENERAIRDCEALGECYQIQGRYDGTLALYLQLIEKIRSNSGEDHPAIARIYNWIYQLVLLKGGDNGLNNSPLPPSVCENCAKTRGNGTRC